MQLPIFEEDQGLNYRGELRSIRPSAILLVLSYSGDCCSFPQDRDIRWRLYTALKSAKICTAYYAFFQINRLFPLIHFIEFCSEYLRACVCRWDQSSLRSILTVVEYCSLHFQSPCLYLQNVVVVVSCKQSQRNMNKSAVDLNCKQEYNASVCFNFILAL